METYWLSARQNFSVNWNQAIDHFMSTIKYHKLNFLMPSAVI